MTFKLHEVLKGDSLKDVIESDFMDKILELNQYNKDQGVDDHLALTINTGHFGQDGPGYPLIRGIHRIMMKTARPIRKRPKGLPSWATHEVEGSYADFQRLLVEEGYKDDQTTVWASAVGRILRYNDLAWKTGPGGAVIYTREWPSDLTPLTIKLTQYQAIQTKVDAQVEKRIKEEAEKNKKVVVVKHYKHLALPDPEKPEDFLRYAEALYDMIDERDDAIGKLTLKIQARDTVIKSKDKLIEGLESDMAAIQDKLEEMEGGDLLKRRTEAVARLKDIVDKRGGTNGKLDESNVAEEAR